MRLLCLEDGVKYKMLEKEWIFDFLHGVTELDEVCCILLGAKPFPSIREVFAEVRREESQKKVMLNPFLFSNNNVSPQNSAIFTLKMKAIVLPRGESQKDK